MEELINKNYTYAVIGASRNREKYGYKVLHDLKSAGYKVIPINPKGSEIGGLKSFAELKAVPEKIDAVIFVVPPGVTEKILHDVKSLGIAKVWMQPGSESGKAIKYCENNGIDCIHDRCMMLAHN
jgi:predicted CoA-binding protein